MTPSCKLLTELNARPIISPSERSTTRFDPYVMISVGLYNRLLEHLSRPDGDGEDARDAARWTVMSEIREELTKAVTKFPTWPTDPLHAVAVLGEEYGELVKDVLQFTYESHKTTRANVRKEAIQCAAMAIRFAESLSVYDYAPGKQHKQAAIDAALSGEKSEPI